MNGNSNQRRQGGAECPIRQPLRENVAQASGLCSVDFAWARCPSYLRQQDGAGLRRGVAALGAALASWLLVSCQSPDTHYGPGAGAFDTVIVDAGHGAHDRGARACAGSPEKSLTLDTARRLADCLRRSGLHVLETRTSDVFIPLGGRVAVANRTGRAVFVSIHYNWARRTGANGIEIYYYSLRSKRLAANILREATRAYRTDNRGIKNRGFYVLRNNNRPAVLCELGFVSNPSDNSNIQNPGVRQRLAERVAAGIIAERAGCHP
jgi:N-acetylmuramoyl-L-alanine amidase